MMSDRKIASMVAGAFIIVIGIIYGFAGFTGIEPGESGLLVKQFGEDKGMQSRTLDTGTHWNDPIMYDIPVYDTRFRQYSLVGDNSVSAQTKDGQPVRVDVSLEMGLLDAKVPWIHEHIGSGYWEKVIYPALRSAIRSEVPSQLSEEIYTNEGRIKVQNQLQDVLDGKYKDKGFIITVNLRDIQFTNPTFVNTLEEKAAAAQRVIIEERNAEAAVNLALSVENKAEGEKQRVIKEAEAEAERLKQEGIGLRDRDIEKSKGILAVAKAHAEGTRLQVNAYGHGQYYAQVKVAEELGDNFQIWGIPTGAEGTSSFIGLDAIMGKAVMGGSGGR